MAASERLVVMLPSDIKKQLSEVSNEERLTMSTYVKMLIIKDLKSKQEVKK